jgi:hypothetical protein
MLPEGESLRSPPPALYYGDSALYVSSIKTGTATVLSWAS